MLPAYLIWLACGEPWLAWNDSDLNFALAATGYISLAPTMLGNLFYLYGVSTNGAAPAAALLYLSPLFWRHFRSAGLASNPSGFVSPLSWRSSSDWQSSANLSPGLTHKRVRL